MTYKCEITEKIYRDSIEKSAKTWFFLPKNLQKSQILQTAIRFQPNDQKRCWKALKNRIGQFWEGHNSSTFLFGHYFNDFWCFQFLARTVGS